MNFLDKKFAEDFIQKKLGFNWNIEPYFEPLSSYLNCRGVFSGGTVVDPSLTVVSRGAWGVVTNSSLFYDLSGCNSDVLGYLSVLGIDPTNVHYGVTPNPFNCIIGNQNEITPQTIWSAEGFVFMPEGAVAKQHPSGFTEYTRGNWAYITPNENQKFDSESRPFLSPVLDYYLFGYIHANVIDNGSFVFDTSDIIQVSDIGSTIPNTSYQNKYRAQLVGCVDNADRNNRFSYVPAFFNSGYLASISGILGTNSSYSFIGWKCSPLQSGTPPTTQIPLPFVS